MDFLRALTNLIRELGIELAPREINVNAIGSGLIETSVTEDQIEDEGFREQALNMSPRKNMGITPDIFFIS